MCLWQTPERKRLRKKHDSHTHENSSFDLHRSVVGRCGGAGTKANNGLRAGQRPQEVLRNPRQPRRRTSGVAARFVHGDFEQFQLDGWIGELSKTRKVIAIEMQGNGRTADINRDFSYENLADDIAAMLDHLKIKQADLLGYSMGGGVAMQVAIRHPEKVRKVVSVSAFFRQDGLVKEALDAFPKMTAESFKGSPIETDYKRLSPTPDEFPNFVKRVIAIQLKPYDFGAEKLKATKAPFLFIHGDADGVRLDHIAEMFRLKGDEIFGDLRPRSDSRLAVLPNTTHVTLMEKSDAIIPMVNDFLDAKPQKK